MLDAGEFESYIRSMGATERFITGYVGDTLWAMVTNENICEGNDTLTICLNPVGLDESLTHSVLLIRLYPNPVDEVLFIEVTEDIDLPNTITIFRQDGRLVFLKKIEEQGILSINIDNFFEL